MELGAAATFKLETEDDVNHFKAEWDHSTVYFFEKFVTSSEICTFDGLVDRDGNIVFSTTFDYAHTPLDLMIYKMDNSYYVLKDMDPKLRKYGEAIVKEFGMKERFFHIEFFREGDDYIAIEYNNRPAGGFTIDVYNYAHSLDLYKGYAAIVAGEAFPESPFETQYCLATSRRANANYVYSEEDLLAKYGQQFKVKKIMPASSFKDWFKHSVMLDSSSNNVFPAILMTKTVANNSCIITFCTTRSEENVLGLCT